MWYLNTERLCQSVEIKINNELIQEFRKKVNEEDFFRVKFRNVKGKNYWNVICSAMDWISVAAEGLPSIKLNPKGMGYDHLETLNIMQYILTVDILAESIIQLYRVLDANNPYPLLEDHDIFKQEKLNDDKYFKHLRAVFSTHPVNLDSLNGVKTGDGERFFASWVSRSFMFDNDYNVSLYSNIPEKDELHFLGLNIKQINLYAEKRYELLGDLINKVEKFNSEYILTFKSSVIPIIDDPREQLILLLKENEDRFGKYFGYYEVITYLLKLVNTDIDSYEFEEYFTNIFKEYREQMITGINEIKDGLQNMTEGKFNIKRRGSGYEFEKIYQYFGGGEHPIGMEYFHGLIKKGKLPSKLIPLNDMNLNMFMLDAYLYSLTKELGKQRIKISDIVQMIYPNGKL